MAFFHAVGKETEEMDRLKIYLRGSAIESAVDLSSRDDISLGPQLVGDWEWKG